MFYDNLKSLCDLRRLKITTVVTECGGALGSISKWRNGANPNSDIVIKLSLHLGVTTDYLLLGKSITEKINVKLSIDEQLLLENYNKLTDEGKNEVSARAKELAKEISSKQTLDKQRLVKMYDLLTDMEKGEILGELKAMTKNRNSDINIQTVRVAARSTDNTPPRMVTGDLSDILNAPDVTDEY